MVTQINDEQKLEDIKAIIFERLEHFGLSQTILDEFNVDTDSFDWYCDYEVNFDRKEARLKRLVFESIKQTKKALKRNDLSSAWWFIYCIKLNTQVLSDFYDGISHDVLRLLDEKVVGKQWPGLGEGYTIPDDYDIPDDLKDTFGA